MRFLLSAILLICGVCVYFLAPGRSGERARRPFAGRTFAHRGLYTADQSVPENTLVAYLAAVEAGYGVHLQVQLTLDGRVVAFHDRSLLRACGVDAEIGALDYAELYKRPLFDTNHRIPLLFDALTLIDGRVPVLVELMPFGDWRALCKCTYDILRDVRGDFCVGSFHPGAVRWFYKNAPELLRGQFSAPSRALLPYVPRHGAFLVSRMLTNFYTHAQFSAYKIGKKCLCARLSEWLGAMRISWTAHGGDDWAMLMRTSECIVFAHCRPAAHFQKHDTPGAVHIDLEPLIKPIEHITAARCNPAEPSLHATATRRD